MTPTRPAGVVVDTMVISWLFDERPNPVAERYRTLIADTPVLLAFQTVMELRYGALRAEWGELLRRHVPLGGTSYGAAARSTNESQPGR